MPSAVGVGCDTTEAQDVPIAVAVKSGEAAKSRRVDVHASSKAESNAISTDKTKLLTGKGLSNEWVLDAYKRLVNYTEKKRGLAKVTKAEECKAIVARFPFLLEKIATQEAPPVPHAVATPTQTRQAANGVKRKRAAEDEKEKRAKMEEANAELLGVLDASLSSPNFECQELAGLTKVQYWALVALAGTQLSELVQSYYNAETGDDPAVKARIKLLRRFQVHALEETVFYEEVDEAEERKRLHEEEEQERLREEDKKEKERLWPSE